MEPIKISIPQELFSPAAYKHFEEDVTADFITMGSQIFNFVSPLHWQLDITNTGDAFLVSGTVEGEAEGSCARCLEATEFPVTGEIEGYFLINRDDSAPNDLEGDEFDYLPDDKTIDLAPLIEQALLLEMPNMLLCSDDCKGLCPTCGTDLNKGECDCASHEPADDRGANNPFAVLKDMKL